MDENVDEPAEDRLAVGPGQPEAPFFVLAPSPR